MNGTPRPTRGYWCFSARHHRRARRKDGGNLVVSERLQFIELYPDGRARNAGAAPYLDYRPATAEERELPANALDAPWLQRGPEDLAGAYATEHLVPRHLDEVRGVRLPQIDKVEREVRARLKTEIDYSEARAEALAGARGPADAAQCGEHAQARRRPGKPVAAPSGRACL
jgi:hypothetical protein